MITPILFLHVPKTAGITIRSIIARQYSSGAVYSVDEHHLGTEIANFRALSKEDKEAIEIIQGHFCFGIHERLGIPGRYITILRDPVQRVISHYYHVLKHSDHHLHADVVSSGMTLKEYVQSEITLDCDNSQVRYLSGIGTDVGFGRCTREVLELAKRNLREYFITAGVSERFDESLLLMREKLNWGSGIHYYPQNVGDRPDRGLSVPDNVARIILQHNSLDVELYQHVLAHLDAQVTERGQCFYRKYHSFVLSNRIYAHFVTPEFLEAGFKAYSENRRSEARRNFFRAVLRNPMLLRNPGVAAGIVDTTLGPHAVQVMRQTYRQIGNCSKSSNK